MQYVYFGKFIREKREALIPKVALNEFALNIDVDKAALSRIERLQQGVKLNVIANIAKGFGMKASELLAEYEELYKNVDTED